MFLMSQGGHDVPPADVRRRFRRSRERFLADYLPLADEWAVWDTTTLPFTLMADSRTHRPEDGRALLEAPPFRESPPQDWSEIIRLCFEASRSATAKKLAYYKRMGIKVTPQMTLAPRSPNARDGQNNDLGASSVRSLVGRGCQNLDTLEKVKAPLASPRGAGGVSTLRVGAPWLRAAGMAKRLAG